MGIFDRIDYLEASLLKLKAEHFPLSCSVHELVLGRCAPPHPDATDVLAIDPEALIGYIRNIENYELGPLEAILAQIDAIGDSAQPTAEQSAILAWLGAAIDDWERRFPIAEPLASQLRRLKPLAAALAVTDSTFLLPGAHPFHQLLDTIQLNAIGWQSRLGRAGHALERQISDSIDATLGWFEGNAADLDAICAEFAASAAREHSRASRMIQRLIEAEQGKLKTADARRTAASMINSALARHRAPASIGEFLKGPWYASAQLVLLKFGAEADQWRQMTQTTEMLLDSLQTPETPEGNRRQYIFETVRSVPKELKRWLLSLQHDAEAVNDAVSVVEFTHLRVLRQQALQLEQIAPIAVDDVSAQNTAIDKALTRLQPGQWFAMEIADGEPLRAKLILRLDQEQQLLFANHAGIKVLQQSFDEFLALLVNRKVVLLDGGASFSRCLAKAAGIETQEQVDALASVAAEQSKREQDAQRQVEQARRKQQLEDARRLQQEQEAARRLEREQEEARRLEQEQEEARRLEQEQEEARRLEQERAEARRLEQEQEEAQQLQREWDEAQRLQRQRAEKERETVDTPPPEQLPEALPVQPAQDSGLGAAAFESGSAQQTTTPNLPMGAWLGFHDGDKPLLAKLAVHDREQDDYTFVNRSGIKMRQIGRQELLRLIDLGLVEILETRSRFREDITRAQEQSDN